MFSAAEQKVATAMKRRKDSTKDVELLPKFHGEHTNGNACYTYAKRAIKALLTQEQVAADLDGLSPGSSSTWFRDAGRQRAVRLSGYGYE